MTIKRFFLLFPFAALLGCSNLYSTDCQEIACRHYIAHGGGTIQGFRYSNSLEAVREALAHGMDYIEMDLCLTADSQLVAWHDWNWQWAFTPTYEQFMSRKVYDRFTPMDFAMIDSIMANNPGLTLVTDKISDPEIIDFYFHPYKQRMWVECFSDEDYGGDISCTMADSIFAIDDRIRFVYVDNYE